jgi:hypothetical protein
MSPRDDVRHEASPAAGRGAEETDQTQGDLADATLALYLLG